MISSQNCVSFSQALPMWSLVASDTLALRTLILGSIASPFTRRPAGAGSGEGAGRFPPTIRAETGCSTT
jgi:hypothetical protein